MNTDRLIESNDPLDVRMVLANDPATPVDLLMRLAQDQDRKVRQAVATNPNTPWKTLEHLAWEFPQAFFVNPAGPLQILAHPDHISTDSHLWNFLLREAPIPSLWWNWINNSPPLRNLQAVHMHVLSAGEVLSPYGEYREGRDDILLTFIELLTAAQWQWERSPLQAKSFASQTRTSLSSLIQSHLQCLAHSAQPDIRQAVASHPHTSGDILWTLAYDESVRVREMVAQHPHIPGALMDSMARDLHPLVRCSVAGHAQLSEKLLCLLSQDRYNDVRRVVAAHPRTSAELLRALALDQDVYVRMGVASHPQVPLDILQDLAQDESEGVREKAAVHPQTSLEILCFLALDTYEGTRQGVASHLRTPVNVLLALAHDPDRSVRAVVASHPHLPIEMLRKLAHDPDRSVRAAVASHPQLPIEMLRKLAHDPDNHVRRMVASHPQTPLEILSVLAQDQEVFVRRDVAANPQATDEILCLIIKNVSGVARSYGREGLEAAMHPHASLRTLQLLTRYPKAHVRWLAHLVRQWCADVGEGMYEQVWWTELLHFFVRPSHWGWIGHTPIETQIEATVALNVPEQIRQMILTALMVNWDMQQVFVTDAPRDAIAILHEQRSFYHHLMTPFLPPSVLQKLARFPGWEVRYLVALHAQTPGEVRQMLSQDGNCFVRAMAKTYLEQAFTESALVADMVGEAGTLAHSVLTVEGIAAAPGITRKREE